MSEVNPERIIERYSSWLSEGGKPMIEERRAAVTAITSLLSDRDFSTRDFLAVWQTSRANHALGFRILTEIYHAGVLAYQPSKDGKQESWRLYKNVEE